MRGIGRSSVMLGFIVTIVFVASAALSGPLGDEPGGGDPSQNLTSAQRAAAQALGDARRLVEAGRPAEARAALARVKDVASLEGYAELVRVHLLMKEGAPSDAYQAATLARERTGSAALRAALGVLRGEALAMGGDAAGAEQAFREVLASTSARDRSVRQSIELSIVAARQRTGSLDLAANPLVLLDQNYAGVTADTSQERVELLPTPVLLERAAAALAAGHNEDALTFYDVALAKPLDPTQLKTAKMGRARALFRERKYAAAVTAYGALLPDLEARFWRARSLVRVGRIEDSLAEFEEVARGSDEDLASWSLYLMGTLYEDRKGLQEAIGYFKRAARYERFPDRMRESLWREGWAHFRTGAHAQARAALLALAAKTEDELDRLKPRYWAARAASGAGDEKMSQRELTEIARDFPLSYYGWRAQERLAQANTSVIVTKGQLSEGTRHVEDEAIERAALLIEAGLHELARDELRYAASNARGLGDRTRVGILLARVGDYHRASELVVLAYAGPLARGLQQGREALWWLSWPPAYRETIAAVFPKDASIDPELVWAIMREESLYRVDARSSVGALGLLQLMPETAAQLAEETGLAGFKSEDLFDPRTNITLGATYLDQLGTRFDGRMSAAIGSYNAGPHRVSSWLEGEARELDDDVWVENIPYDQTRSYVKRVMRSLHVYKSFYR